MVFGLQVKRVKVRPAQSPTQMLESLFFSTTSSSSSSSSQRRRSRAGLDRSVSAPRPPSSIFTEQSDSATLPRWPRHTTDSVVRYDGDSQLSFRLPQAVVICDLQRAGRLAHLALADALRTRRITLGNAVWNLPPGFFVVDVSAVDDDDPSERPTIHPSLVSIYFTYPRYSAEGSLSIA
jgi:hypothetical protein